MKKIIYTLLVAVMALSFMGCPTVYEDLAPQVYNYVNMLLN